MRDAADEKTASATVPTSTITSTSTSTATATVNKAANSDTHLPTPALSPITEHAVIKGETAVSGNGHVATPDVRDREEPVSETKGVPDGAAHDHQDATTTTTATEGATQLKLSPAQIYDLTSSPGSVPIRPASPTPEEAAAPLLPEPAVPLNRLASPATAEPLGLGIALKDRSVFKGEARSPTVGTSVPSIRSTSIAYDRPRPASAGRSSSSPLIRRKPSTTALRKPSEANKDQIRSRRPTLTSLKLGDSEQRTPSARPSSASEQTAQPTPAVLPLPPLSLPTYLQLELSSERPSALYIHHSAASDVPYESSKVKFERLLNFLLLPPQLEQTLCFGALACLDAWLYTFTILPLRFIKAVVIWLQWWVHFVISEAKDIASFVWNGIGRLWQRRRLQPDVSLRNLSDPLPPQLSATDTSFSRTHLRIDDPPPAIQPSARRERAASTAHRHKRSRSTPSALLPNHKADLLQGLLIVFSCIILLRFDASRIYHNIRGQSVIKLYVIYNSLEVCDRLFGALGQDVLECLFSKETLERKPNGRSKVIRPLWMFVLALVYNVIHAAALYYQVITLNVAVNSYSNALLTLLMSNQFVEIKGSVFKKLEKENLFQMTCADVVERFQLWLMLLIIALRNIVEMGGLSMNTLATSNPSSSVFNASGIPVQVTGILPKAFTWIPKWSGQVFGPFLIVLGSEMLVDWLKHAYINKFNSVKPDIYGRFLDVLAKDYYSHAFVDQNLMKRLGLPVLPLACLFIRASVQTYHMFVATHMPLPMPSSATALVVESASSETSPATTAAFAHIDLIFRRALGRSSFGAGAGNSSSDNLTGAFSWWSIDDVIAFATMALFFLILYLFLLALKLVLGIVLLSFARSRYRGMRERERRTYDAGSKRVGGFGAVEVDDDKRRCIYEDDAEALRNLREKEAKARDKERERDKAGKGDRLDGVGRYMMVAKRIW